jgi:hypothetical protein
VRWILAALCLLWAGPVWAASPKLRISTTPSAGAVATVHPMVGLAAQAQGRFLLTHAGPGDRLGFALSGGVHVRPHPVLAVSLGYLYGFGEYPVEGVADREHRVAPGLQVSSRGSRFIVSNTVRLDLRTLAIPGSGWTFAVRPRDALRLTSAFLPWLKLSAETELLLQPRDGRTNMLQIRAGLALHGEIALRREERKDRPPPALFWIVGDQVALLPVALTAAPSAGFVDMIPYAGLAVLF